MGRIKLLFLTLCCIFYLNNHQYELGRDKDPRKENEISYLNEEQKKMKNQLDENKLEYERVIEKAANQIEDFLTKIDSENSLQ